MTLLALPAGLLLPTLCGWLLLRLLEGKHAVLYRTERWVTGCVLGLTSTMFVSFVLQVTLNVPFSFIGFGTAQLGLAILLGALWYAKRSTLGPSPLPAHSILSRWQAIGLGTLLTLLVAKIVLAGATFLILTPTYLQDTLKNWNLRGKVFYETEMLTLVMPNEDPLVSPRDISSYPPTVPMIKTWLADIAGTWDEALVNSIHIVWYLAALLLLFYAVRRYASLPWALLGTYILGSLPLYLMHGTNAYADAFVSVHILLAISFVLHAMRAHGAMQRMAWFRLAALATCLIPLTKNEGILVHLPPLLLVTALLLLGLRRFGQISSKQLFTAVGWYALLGLLPAFWLGFKWVRGLTFGNGKPFTSLGFGWQENVLYAVTINTFAEGNWLLLFPFFFGLLVWRFKTALGELLPLTAFVLIVYFGQMALYLFTGLSTEALMQTGYARGLVQLAPTIVLLTTLLLHDAWPTIGRSFGALRMRKAD